MNRKTILAFLMLLGVLFVARFTVLHFASFEVLDLSYKNAHDITVYKSDATTYKSIGNSSQKIKLPRGDYTIGYSGDSGYSDGSVDVKVYGDGTKINIDPDYSEERLQSALPTEKSSISSALHQSYPNIDTYKIGKESLYAKGEWYGASLRYAGDDIFNYDTLKVVMHKRAGVWMVVSNPPTIYLTTVSAPDTPERILEHINDLD